MPETPEAMKRSALLSSFCLIGCIAACSGVEHRPTATPAGEVKSVAAESPSPAREAQGIRFVDVTAESGVRWVHNHGGFGQRWLPETLGPGVVVLDANVDGRLDLLFVNGRNFPGKPGEATTPALYLNQGGLKFKEATRESGLDFSVYCLGGAAGDIDNDGDPDVYLACLGQDLLLRNQSGRFQDVSGQAGLSRNYEFGAAAAFFDADRDGFLDVYATRYVSWTPEIDLFCSLDGKTKVYCIPAIYDGAPQRYYRNRGDGTFEDKTREAGLDLPAGKMLGVLPFDADSDGWPDLAVAGDNHPNLLYHNLGNGRFEEVGLVSGIGVSLDGGARGGMGIDAGDYDRTGRASLAISYFANDETGLYRNEGNVFFLDLGPGSEIGRKTFATVGWGCFFFDYDLDGWLDFLVANGHLDPDRPTPHPQPQQLFRNLGGNDFVEVTDTAGGDLARPIVGRGAAYGDLDEDGDLDLVVMTNGGPAKVFENRGAAHGNWLRITLQGTVSNRDALGTEVKVTVAGSTQTLYVHSGGSYLSQSQIDPTFGLGSAAVADEVVVRWPSGLTQRFAGVKANQRFRLREPQERIPD